MEREANNKFHVFDIQLIRNGSHLETTVYRKPSASDRYLHFTSAQAWQEKAAAIHTLVARALHYCSTKLLLDAELLHITNVFIANGYPQKAIANIIAMKSHKHEALDSVEQLEETYEEKSEIDFSKSFYAPYHPRARKMFKSLQKTFGINCVFKTTATEKSNGTHRIWCTLCHVKIRTTNILVRQKD